MLFKHKLTVAVTAVHQCKMHAAQMMFNDSSSSSSARKHEQTWAECRVYF